MGIVLLNNWIGAEVLLDINVALHQRSYYLLIFIIRTSKWNTFYIPLCYIDCWIQTFQQICWQYCIQKAQIVVDIRILFWWINTRSRTTYNLILWHISKRATTRATATIGYAFFKIELFTWQFIAMSFQVMINYRIIISYYHPIVSIPFIERTAFRIKNIRFVISNLHRKLILTNLPK